MVDYRVKGSIAILEVNNPPVNALSHQVRQGLFDGIARAEVDSSVQAVVVIGKDKTFPAGADITEFDQPMKSPSITEAGSKLEWSNKPVIAAIHGTALGGGLEVALFCHYRLALRSARVGFPEVALGLLPAAGGTQRLPRVTDISIAMDIIASGKHVPAPKALEYGILNKIVDGDLLQESIKFAKSVIGKPLTSQRLSQLPVKGAENVTQAFDAAMQRVKQRNRGMMAPVVCLKSVRNAVELPYEEGMQREVALFMELKTGSQSAALRYAFFAERAAQKWSLPCGANASNTQPGVVKTTGVIGAGTMGSGIAVCLLRAGFPVILVEQNQAFLEKGVSTIQMILKDAVRRQLMTEDTMQQFLSHLTPSTDLASLANVDLVIEAVYENVDLKKDIFRRLDQLCKPSTFLCTNTSTIDIDIIAGATQRPGQVVGTHFFAPPHIMRLLENVYGPRTSPKTVATVMSIGRKIGKVTVLVKSCWAFVANRMHNPWTNEASFMVEEGASPQQVDRVLEDFGMPMGPFKIADVAGGDVRWRIKQERAKEAGVELTPSSRYFLGERYCSLPDKMYHKGRLGSKTGKGWYRYSKPGSRIAIDDSEVNSIINQHCKEQGIQRRSLTTQEILERCLFSCINEGFRCLEEGVAAKPEVIDAIFWYGFSFPRHMGGPMFYASQVGLNKVYDRVCYYHKQFPYSSHWVPSDLLRKLASAPSPVPIGQWVHTWTSKL